MNIGARTLLAVLWLVHWLPLGAQAAIGRLVGALLFRLVKKRRRIALRNLELALPELGADERERIARDHFAWLGRSLIERGLLWYGSRARIERLLHVEGDVGLAGRADKPVMWLVPHFVGLDVAGLAVQLYSGKVGGSIYQAQSNKVLNAAVRRGRMRFGNSQLFARSDSAKPIIRAIKQGYGFFNLPDMDFGERDAAFVPFFGIDAATLLAPSRMAKALGMLVQPVVAEILPGGRGYKVRFFDPLDWFPTDDALADTAALNRWIESQVRADPAQYLWVHKRFKTRPAGEASLYDGL